MNDNNYIKAIQFTAKWEGRDFVNDPNDPGGKTKYGIADRGDGKIDGMADLDRDGIGDKKIEDLDANDQLSYFYTYYWVPSGCRDLPLHLAVVVFDSAINCGVKRATGWLKQTQDPKQYIEIRRMFYYDLCDKNTSLRKFIKGWMARLNDLNKYIDILQAT